MLKKMLWLFVAMVVLAGSMQAAEKKVLFLNSYHAAYPWSAGIIKGVKDVLGDKAELKIHDMDTKRQGSEEFKKKAAEEAKALIEEWKPDVVIAADDNASKYVIVPYFKGSDVPFVFCGVNWDASGYGFPVKNVTGMVEVALVLQLIDAMKKVAKGDKVGFFGADTETNRKEIAKITEKFGLEIKTDFAKDLAEWKEKFPAFQKEVDMVIIGAPSFAADNPDELAAFMVENTKVPTGAIEEWVAPFALISYAKDATEQGQWAAAKALQIVGGTSPADIEIEPNKRAKIVVNAKVMKSLGAALPMELIEQATVLK